MSYTDCLPNDLPLLVLNLLMKDVDNVNRMSNVDKRQLKDKMFWKSDK